METTERKTKTDHWIMQLGKMLLGMYARLALFGGTYIAAAIIANRLWGYAGLVSGQSPTTPVQPDYNDILLWCIIILAIPVLFPTGWMFLFNAFNDPASQVGLKLPGSLGCLLGLALTVMAYPVYAGIAIAATLITPLIKRRWIFAALYVIFVLLLLVNIKGCTQAGELGGAW